MLVVIITILSSDGCLSPDYMVVVDFHPNSLKSPGGWQNQGGTGKTPSGPPQLLPTRILSQISQNPVISMAPFELKTFSPAASLLDL